MHKLIQPAELILRPFQKLDKEWFLLTSGGEGKYNTMTASWGTMGTLWGKSVLTAFVRHSRHTFDFMEENKYFTASFFPPEYHSALAFCGANSGKDVDKAEKTGLTPVFVENFTYFEQAELVFVCRKLYAQDFDPDCFTLPSIGEFYSKDAIHRQYIGEICEILKSE